jgi:hypothetical protein
VINIKFTENIQMKKLISTLLAVGLLLNLCACGDKKEDSGNNSTPAKTQSPATPENNEEDVTPQEQGEITPPTGEVATFLTENNWYTTDNTGVLMFNFDGTYSYFTNTQNDDGSMTTELTKSGNWAIDDENDLEITIDGETEYCTVDNYFYVGGLGLTFSNGQISAEVLESWYGTYSGELGEVEITESIFDNSLSVSIYLNDDMGSMYSSSSLKLDYTGEFAQDDYIEIIFDGEYLTIVALDSEFENYAGDYVKQQTEE